MGGEAKRGVVVRCYAVMGGVPRCMQGGAWICGVLGAGASHSKVGAARAAAPRSEEWGNGKCHQRQESLQWR
jgi:hypothetical protein